MTGRDVMDREIERAQRAYTHAMACGNVEGMDRARERFERLSVARRSRARTMSTLRMVLGTRESVRP